MITKFLVLFVAFGICSAATEDRWKVIGGQEAKDGAYPFSASLRNARNEHFCGGSIITPRSVLTAAHCIFGRFSANVSAVVGSNKLDVGGSRYQASSLKMHFDYEPRDLSNDIGFVVLNQDIVYNTKVQPIQLRTDYVAAGVDVILAGWGYASYPGTVNNELLEVKLTAITVPDCRSRMTGINVVYENQLCTLTKAGEGTCFGDSGGPLILGTELVGIVSWGSPSSCGVGYPDVYTRISSFVRWIETNKV